MTQRHRLVEQSLWVFHKWSLTIKVFFVLELDHTNYAPLPPPPPCSHMRHGLPSQLLAKVCIDEKNWVILNGFSAMSFKILEQQKNDSSRGCLLINLY